MKKFSARLLSALLAMTLILSFTACGQKPEPDDGSTPVSDVSTTTTTTEDTTTTENTGDTTEDATTTTEDASADTTTGAQGTTGKTPTTKPSTATTKPTTKPSSRPGNGPSAYQPSTVPTPGPNATRPTSTTTSTTSTTKTTTTTTTTTTVPTQDPNFKSIKVLSMGHSFSKDAMEKYLWDIFASAGYDEIVLGFMYIGGCPLEQHWINAQQNLSNYEYFKNTNGKWVVKANTSAKYALTD